MRTQIKSVIGEELVLEVKVKLSGSMLDGEEAYPATVNGVKVQWGHNKLAL